MANNQEEKTRPMERRLTSIDQRIIEAAQRAIDRERAKGNPPTPLPAAQRKTEHPDPRVQEALDRAYRAMEESRNGGFAQAQEEGAVEDAAEAAGADAPEENAVQERRRGKHENTAAQGNNSSAVQSAPAAEDAEQTGDGEREDANDDGQQQMSDEVRQEISADQASAIDRLHMDDGLDEPDNDATGSIPMNGYDAPQPAETVQAAANIAAPEPRRLAHVRPLPIDRIKAPAQQEVPNNTADITSAYLDAFFSELQRCGVEDYVISPGSRSTGLAMKAFERFKGIYVDVDERGAAFFALGLAKAKRKPVAVICTSGTAVGNWMPAVLEAESSRVPLIFLSGDRPARLQQVGAPQTCDQLKLFGDHVKKFVNMPEPSRDPAVLDYARQTALECCIAAYGNEPGAASCDAGPVHVNFPFDEPLKPSKKVVDDAVCPLPPTVVPGQGLFDRDARGLFQVLNGKRTIALCGEGCCNSEEDARVLIDFAHARNVPLLADPLSGLRCYDDPFIIDNYDTVLGKHAPATDVIIRFGRWPVSKRLFSEMSAQKPVQVVVDMRSPRDYAANTSLFVRTLPVVFAQAMLDVPAEGGADVACASEWMELNDKAGERIGLVTRLPGEDQFEGSYVNKLLELIPEGSLLFSASSMSIRAIDTFYRKSSKQLRVLCNRGLNGIDGTLSSAIGAAQVYSQTTLLTGDLAFLHDCNALALQNEMHIRETRGEGKMPAIAIVLLNNNGGAIFDMLPQKSSEDYFGRLFLTPQNIEVKHLAQAFGASYRKAETVDDFRRVYQGCLGVPGITVIDISLPLAGVKDRYGTYW